MSVSEPISPGRLEAFIQDLREAAAAHDYRAVALLSGEAAWCREQASALVTLLCSDDGNWVAEQAPRGLERLDWSRVRTRLGREAGWLVIDAFDGFDAEGFGALCGTLRAGGLLLLLTPPLDGWPGYPDPQQQRFALYPHSPESLAGHFLARLVRVLQASPGVAMIAQGKPLPELPTMPQGEARPVSDGVCIGAEQREAVQKVRHVAEGHHARPFVLSADRGRGKSAALGIAAAQLLHGGLEQVVVSAPRLAATEQLFAHAQGLLPGCEAQRGRLLWQGRSIEFTPPDALLLAPRRAQLLLVDEAAALPVATLTAMLERFHRCVFASTIHGYEGSGRGFSLRFQKVLDARAPGWSRLHLSAPIRWGEGDPLERLCFRALLLDAEPVPAARVAAATPATCQIERVEPAALASRERELSELFGLLVLAHYRTSPNDLRQLLDGPQQSLYLMRHAGHVVATALVVEEGGLEPELAQEVYLGRRRVQGHLLPQSLANHAGFPEAAGLRAARVMRIAVHPALQGRGLGSQLLQQLQQDMRQRGCDYLGSSFGATVELLRFWQRQGLLPVRLGLSREMSSGGHAAMMLAPLSPRGERLFLELWERFAEQLPELLAGPLAMLEDTLTRQLLALAPPIVQERIGRQDRRDLESFAFGLRGYELCMLAIRKLSLQALGDHNALAKLTAVQQQLLRDKVLQRHSWEHVVRNGGYRGKRDALEALRVTSAVLVRHYFGGAGLPG